MLALALVQRKAFKDSSNTFKVNLYDYVTIEIILLYPNCSDNFHIHCFVVSLPCVTS